MVALAALAGVQEPRDHGRHEESVCRAGLHGPDQACGVGFAGHDRRHPRPDAEQRVTDAADVKEGHRDEVRVPLGERERRRQVCRMVDQRTLAQQDTFRSSGGAGAVDHQRGFTLVDLFGGLHGCCRGEQRFVLVLVAAHHHDAFQTVDSRRARLDRRAQLGADKKHTCTAVVEDVDDFIADHSPIDDGGDSAD